VAERELARREGQVSKRGSRGQEREAKEKLEAGMGMPIKRKVHNGGSRIS